MTARRRILLAELTPSIPQPLVFATWNPADKHADIALSGGDLIATKTTTDPAAWACVRGTVAMDAGQWYWETTVNFTGSSQIQIGICEGSPPLYVAPSAGSGFARKGALALDGNYYDSILGLLGNIGAISSGGVIRHWLDMDSGTYRIANGAGAWTAVAAIGWWTQRPTILYPIVGFVRQSGTTASCTANFGASPFAYTPPDGANAGVYAGTATPTSIYLGSEGLDATIGATPVHFMGRIAGNQDVEIEREASCWVWGGQSLSRRGQLVVVNNDGALDAWREYIWRDAPVLLRAGYEGDAYGDFEPWAWSRVDTIELTREKRIVLSFADPVAVLSKQLQPDLYPADQANLQLAGKPLPIVYGSPLYCTPAKLSTVPAERDYQLHDKATGGTALTSIAAVYDSGDIFNGPDDPFTPHDAVTAANGGNFLTWGGTPSMPTNWTLPAGAGVFVPTDRFFDGGSGGGGTYHFLGCISQHATNCAMQHNVSTLNARTLYRITFNCTSILSPGSLIFRAPGSPDVSVSLTTTGPKSVALYVREATKLQMVMRGDGINVFIKELLVSAEQVIDWTYWGTTRGFTLNNTPYGKIVANPVSPLDTLPAIAADIATRTALPDITIDGVTVDGLDAASTAAIGTDPVAAYIDTPKSGLDLLKGLLNSWCGYVTSNRLGQIVVGKITTPSNEATGLLVLDQSNVSGEIIVTSDIAKSLTLRLAGRKNHSVHTDAEIASSVPDDLSAALQTPFGATVTGAPISTDPVSSAYLAAIAAPAQETAHMDVEAMQAEANRVATLWRPARNFYLVQAILDATTADQLEPGQTVTLVWPRWGLDAGKNLLVIGVRSRFFSRRVDLKLWG